MIRSAIKYCVIVPLLGAATPLLAQNSPALDDMKCVAASAVDKTDDGQDRIGLLQPFFIGKLTGRDPAFNGDALTAQHKTELDRLAEPKTLEDTALAKQELERCYTEIRAATALLKGM